jgi:histone H3/H4
LLKINKMSPKLAETTVSRLVKAAGPKARAGEDATAELMGHVDAYLDDLADAAVKAADAMKLKTVTKGVLKNVLSRPVHGFTHSEPSAIVASKSAAESKDSKGRAHRGVSLAYVKDRVAKRHGLRCGHDAQVILQNAVTAYADAIVSRAWDFTTHAGKITINANAIKAGSKHLC